MYLSSVSDDGLISYFFILLCRFRDIKPDNMLVTYQGDVDMSDFGLAGVYPATSLPISSTSVKGTPAYMLAGIHTAADQQAAGTQVTPYDPREAERHALVMSELHMLVGSYAMFDQLLVSSKAPDKSMAAHIEELVSNIASRKLLLCNISKQDAAYFVPVLQHIAHIAGVPDATGNILGLDELISEAKAYAKVYASVRCEPAWCQRATTAL